MVKSFLFFQKPTFKPAATVRVVGYALNSIPELIGSPGNSAVNPLYFLYVNKFCEVRKILRFEILTFSNRVDGKV
jgi:hypothetical protein